VFSRILKKRIDTQESFVVLFLPIIVYTVIFIEGGYALFLDNLFPLNPDVEWQRLSRFSAKIKLVYEYEIWLPSFFAYSQERDTPDNFTLLIVHQKASAVIFTEGGQAPFRSQNDKTSNIR